MKLNHIIHLALAAIALLTASCSIDDALIDPQADEKLQSYTLYLDANAPSFETELDGETRASGNSWEDGDLIYIAFSNGGNTVISNATYKSNLGAFQFSSTSLSSITDASCRVYYFRGGSFSESNGTVKMDKYTAIFTDTDAKYSCSNYTITLFAALKPYTWRLCFKGSVGRMVQLNSSSSILYNSSLDLTLGSFTIKTEDASLQVQTGGYTQYLYGLFTGASNSVQIDIDVEGTSYSRTIVPSKLNVGESGYFTLPVSHDLHGWTKTTLTGVINGHEYVDLGLPSGTLWASCNVGASKPEEYGGYYAWGETEEKLYYEWSTYVHCDGTYGTCHQIGDDIAGTEYDVAHVKWGDSWSIPSIDLLKELMDNCSVTWTTSNGVYGAHLMGPNGVSIFLPATGYRWSSINEKSSIYFWSSSASTDQEYNANYIHLSSSNYWSWGSFFRYSGLPVRAIVNPENEPKSNCPDENHPHLIDLGSAGKWACCNIGATKPEEYGGYYAWGEIEEKDYYDWSTYTCSCYYDISSTEYDVAHVKWGGSWHMPSYSDFGYLMTNCSHEWTTQNGVEGVLVTSSNGNKIFLPAAGGRAGASLSGVGSWGKYWSSTPDEEYSQLSYDLSFYSNGSWGWSYDGGQYKGQSVRAVGR